MDKELHEEGVAGKRVVNGVEVKTFLKEFIDCSILEVEAGTTGFAGGDTGNGGRTYFRLHDVSSTDMSCSVHGDVYGHQRTIEVMFGGDAEMKNFIDALEFAADVLRRQAYGSSAVTMPTRKECRQNDFRSYLSDLLRLYHDTGKLKGISTLGRKYRVTSLSITQFFMIGLHEAAMAGDYDLPREFCNEIYEFVLGHSEELPRYDTSALDLDSINKK